MNSITKLPDGSAFFTGLVGPRERHDLISRLKYHRKGYARKWLYTWRNFRFAYFEAEDSVPFWKALRWALDL